MSGKINIDLKSLKFILSKNRSYIFSIVVILISIMLFFQFVIPQFNALLKTREETREMSLRLEVLKENLNILANVDEEALDSQFRVLSQALPLNKDFIGILNSVYLASQKTGANLGSFSFKVGDLAQSENKDNFSVVKLSIPINSGVTAISDFVEAISKTLPLSEVNAIKVGNISSTVNLSFYYKPLDTSSYSGNVRVSPISQKGLTLINQLNEFTSTSFSSSLSIPVASSSGQ